MRPYPSAFRTSSRSSTEAAVVYMRQVRLAFELAAAGADAVERHERRESPRSVVARWIEVARQRIRLAGAALIEEHQVTAVTE